jgi:hypothetical protein
MVENNSAAVAVVVDDADAHSAQLPILETDRILVLRGTRREEAEHEYGRLLHNKDGKKAVAVLDLADTKKSIMSLIVKEFMVEFLMDAATNRPSKQQPANRMDDVAHGRMQPFSLSFALFCM